MASYERTTKDSIPAVPSTSAHSIGLIYWHIVKYACGEETEADFRGQT